MELSKTSETAKLWLSYQCMPAIARARCSRANGVLGDASQCYLSLLAYITATGYENYLRSAGLYLQKMGELKDANADVHQMSQSGLFVIQ